MALQTSYNRGMFYVPNIWKPSKYILSICILDIFLLFCTLLCPARNYRWKLVLCLTLANLHGCSSKMFTNMHHPFKVTHTSINRINSNRLRMTLQWNSLHGLKNSYTNATVGEQGLLPYTRIQGKFATCKEETMYKHHPELWATSLTLRWTVLGSL